MTSMPEALGIENVDNDILNSILYKAIFEPKYTKTNMVLDVIRGCGFEATPENKLLVMKATQVQAEIYKIEGAINHD